MNGLSKQINNLVLFSINFHYWVVVIIHCVIDKFIFIVQTQIKKCPNKRVKECRKEMVKKLSASERKK